MSAGFIIILAVFSIGLWGYARQAANNSFDRLLYGAGLAMLERAYFTSNQVRIDIPYSAFEILGQANNDRIFYRVFTQDNVTVTQSHKLTPVPDYRPKEEPIYWDDQINGERVRMMQQARLLTKGDTSLWLIVQLGQTYIARQEMISDLFIRGFAVALFITIIGLLFVWIGINRALHPLIDIEKNLRKRDISDFTPLEAPSPREVASLVLSINGYIYRLKSNLDHSQNFIADVGHQIRTSLSALHGHLELAGEEKDSETLQNRLKKAERQSKQTIHLTNQLLSHALVTHRANQKNLFHIRISKILKDTLETILRTHVKSEIEFSVFIPKKIEAEKSNADIILGDALSIREAIRNIIDNAIKHGPENNHIEIALYEHSKNIVLQVDDAGPGIPTEAMEKVLERFYTSTQGGEGSGLGLSIAHEVAKSHDAKLELSHSKLGGLCVKLIFIRKLENA